MMPLIQLTKVDLDSVIHNYIHLYIYIYIYIYIYYLNLKIENLRQKAHLNWPTHGLILSDLLKQ